MVTFGSFRWFKPGEAKTNLLSLFTYSMHVSRVELGGFLQEGETRVRVNHILDKRHEVFRRQSITFPSREDVHEPGCLVVARGCHSGYNK